MEDTVALREAVTGLLSFAAAQEQLLLTAATAATAAENGRGSPDRWAAVPLVAHNNHFKRQQAERLEAVRAGQVPPAYDEIDHGSADLYQAYAAQPTAGVLTDSRQVSAELIDATWALPAEDLLDPGRHPWLNGRMLWLQIIVRGFWHPTGHAGDYYLAHGQAERAVTLQAHALATARYLRAPAAAAGMAGYSLACALAQAGRPDEALPILAEAIAANPDLRVNASRDRDLTGLRDSGELAAVLLAAR